MRLTKAKLLPDKILRIAENEISFSFPIPRFATDWTLDSTVTVRISKIIIAFQMLLVTNNDI
jgi:hypothetical protein